MQRFAEALACHALVAACQKFVQKFFAHVAEGAEFLSLDVEHVSPFKSPMNYTWYKLVHEILFI